MGFKILVYRLYIMLDWRCFCEYSFPVWSPVVHHLSWWSWYWWLSSLSSWQGESVCVWIGQFLTFKHFEIKRFLIWDIYFFIKHFHIIDTQQPLDSNWNVIETKEKHQHIDTCRYVNLSNRNITCIQLEIEIGRFTVRLAHGSSASPSTD